MDRFEKGLGINGMDIYGVKYGMVRVLLVV